MELSRAYNSTRIKRGDVDSYSDVSVFENCNAIKKLSQNISLLEIINPTSVVCGKLMEIVARSKCLKEFELLPDGDLLYNNPSRVESPEGAGKARVKT
jgi:hypothetical protein